MSVQFRDIYRQTYFFILFDFIRCVAVMFLRMAQFFWFNYLACLLCFIVWGKWFYNICKSLCRAFIDISYNVLLFSQKCVTSPSSFECEQKKHVSSCRCRSMCAYFGSTYATSRSQMTLPSYYPTVELIFATNTTAVHIITQHHSTSTK